MCPLQLSLRAMCMSSRQSKRFLSRCSETHYSIMKAMEAIAISTFYDIGTRKFPGDCPLGGEWPLDVPCIGGDAGPGIVDIG